MEIKETLQLEPPISTEIDSLTQGLRPVPNFNAYWFYI